MKNPGQGRSQEFATAGQKGVWGRKYPSRVHGQSQKLETHAKYSTEQSHKSSQIAYFSESDYTLKKIPATTGEHASMPPGYATDPGCECFVLQMQRQYDHVSDILYAEQHADSRRTAAGGVASRLQPVHRLPGDCRHHHRQQMCYVHRPQTQVSLSKDITIAPVVYVFGMFLS